MKPKVIILLILGFIFYPLLAQEPTEEIVKAFTNGKAELLQPFLKDEVSLSVVNRKFRVNKKDAVDGVQDFFESIVIQSFKLRHSCIKEESGYMIGSLQASNQRYRVNCFYTKINDKYFINQIRIDKSNE